MLRDGRLRIVTDRRNYIYHDGRDYKMIGQAMKSKIIKQTTKVPIRRKLAKTQDAIQKAKIEAEEVKASELLTED